MSKKTAKTDYEKLKLFRSAQAFFSPPPNTKIFKFKCSECGYSFTDGGTGKALESECPDCGEWNYSEKIAGPKKKS